jgi:molecular chaperone GrpE
MPEELEQQQEGAQESEPQDSASLKEALAEQKRKADQYLANWQRAGADLANYKKRVEQERQDQAAFSNAMLISSLLPIMDDMERAFDSIDTKLAGLTWVDGMRLVYRKLQATLEAQGLSPIRSVGERFDPKLHEAVMEAEGEQGKVIAELQKGYKLHDRVIRPAIVTVGRSSVGEGAQKAGPPGGAGG